MYIEILKSKIHRATITDACLDYEGSISIDATLMKAANIQENEKVHIFNVTNGNRLITYAIAAPQDSGEICINGAAAHLMKKKHIIIIVAFGMIDEKKAHQKILREYNCQKVYVDQHNKIISSP